MLQYMEIGSVYLLPVLLTSQVGQTIFALLELIDILNRDNWRDYFGEAINIPDYICFFAHTTFFLLKLVQTGSYDPINESKD